MSEAELEVEGVEIEYLVLSQILKGLEYQAKKLLPKMKRSQSFGKTNLVALWKWD